MNLATKSAYRCLAALGLLAALAGPSTSVIAQTTPQSPKEATYICRQPVANEPVTAKMVSGSTTLVCRPLAINMRMSDGTMKTIGNATVTPQQGPDFSKALTPQQFQQACETWLERVFFINHSA
jgi:hypothetical protein